jgi:hypothetical protein
MRILAWVRDWMRGVPVRECGRVPRKVTDLSEMEIQTRVKQRREELRQLMRRAEEIGL